MLEALWSAFAHPSTIIGRDGAGTMVLLACAVALVTAGFMATVGRRVMAYSSVIAVVMGCSFLPVLMNILAFFVARNHPTGIDGGGILVFAVLVLSIGALPITLATSVLYVIMRHKRLAT